MYLLLLLVGLLMTVAGFVAIGFGIRINPFSLGDSLVVAGSTLISGGLVLVGLAVVVRQLQLVAAAITARGPPANQTSETMVPPTARLSLSPMPASQTRSSESIPPRPQEPRPSESRAVEPRAAEPRAGESRSSEPRGYEPRTPEPRPSEPRAAAPQSSDRPSASSEPQGPLSWLRAKPRPGGEPPITELTAEPPQSQRVAPRGGASPPSETDESRTGDDDTDAARSGPASEPGIERAIRAAPAAERPQDTGLFDVAQPAAKPAAAASRETARREPRNIPLSRARPEPSAARRAAPQAAPAPERTAAILKSGVIDGMAYTLYADGSIEAELPQGTLTFASVDALRAHLEKHGG